MKFTKGLMRIALAMSSMAFAITAHAQIGTWVFRHHMQTPRSFFAAAGTPDGGIFAIGGLAGGDSMDSVEAYSPNTDTWTNVSPMPQSRYGHAAVTGPDGRIYVIGGISYENGQIDESPETSVIAYDPQLNTWASVADLPEPLALPEAEIGVDGRIYVFQGSSNTPAIAYAYDCFTDTWSQILTGPQQTDRLRGIASDAAGKIYLIGGAGFSDASKAGITFDTYSGIWNPLPLLPVERDSLAASRGRNGNIFAIGGSDGANTLATVVTLRPGTSFWVNGPSLNVGRRYPASARGADKKIYVLGGQSANSTGYLDSVETLLTSNIQLASFAAGHPVEGTPFTGALCTLTLGDPTNAVDEITATVDWGDGETGDGTLEKVDNLHYRIVGPHTYAEAGTYQVEVSVYEQGTFFTGGGYSMDVADADITGDVIDFTAEAGTKFEGKVASFTDANPLTDPTSYEADVYWGDNNFTGGTIAPDGNGGFTVTAHKTYTAGGAYAIDVYLKDIAANATHHFHGFAIVNNASPKVETVDFYAIEGIPSTGAVGSFTHPNTNLTVADFVVSINWGDGSVTPGLVGGSNGSFNVGGSHIYHQAGNYPITLTVTPSGANGSSSQSTAIVSGAPITATGFNLIAKTTKFSGTVATFTDGNPFGVAGDYSAAIFWGDGKSSVGTVTAAGAGFKVAGTHTYGKKGKFVVTISIRDTGGSTATTTTNLNVGPVK